MKTKSLKAAYDVFLGTVNVLTAIAKMVEDYHFEKAVRMLTRTKKHIWTLGMGKAGMIAHKLASTLSSNATPAAFINAGEALHGDFGAIQEGDILVAFSNSGQTSEVMQVVHKAITIGAKVILITGHGRELAKSADAILLYGRIKEACPLGLTPTTSIAVMLAISDALAMAVQAEKGLTPAEYAMNHHAGYLGQIAREKARRQCKELSGDPGANLKHTSNSKGSKRSRRNISG
jgi:arabinose-5-phosphate isomerase